MLSFQALHLFWFTANELQTHLLYIWPIENAHALYSKMAAARLAIPIVMPTVRVYILSKLHTLPNGIYAL